MNNFAKLPIEKCTSLLGIQDRKERRYCYKKDSDELLDLDDLDQILRYTGQIDYARPLDKSARKTVHQLLYHGTYLKTMKADAVKIYFLLHFLITDFTNGTIERAQFSELSEETGCTERTVKASLSALSEEGYITFTKLNARFFTATILDYAGMFKKAKDGGHGYLTLSKEAAVRILSLRGINDIRIALVSLFESVQNERSSSSKELGAVISFDCYRKAMPDYMRPCHIRKAVEGLSGVFGNFTENYKEYKVRLDRVFSAQPLQNAARQEARQALRERFREIQKAVDAFNRELEESLCVNQDILGKLRSCGLSYRGFNQLLDREDVPKFRFKDLPYNADLIESLSGIAVNFNLPVVLKAISVYYEEYINGENRIEVKNIPGLITAIIKDILHLQDPVAV